MSGSTITAVVFDLDDTLYPEREYAFSGFDAVAAAFEELLGDRSEVAAQMRQLFDTEHRPRVFNTLLSRLPNRAAGLSPRESPDDEELVKRMIQTYREHTPSISLHADADTALTRLRTTHRSSGPHPGAPGSSLRYDSGPYAFGLITDGPVESQSAKINALGLRPHLDAIVLTDELGPGFAKPHPRAFELIARQLAVNADKCAYIADNPAKDFIAPNALGWTTIQITRPDGIYRDNKPAEGGTPDHIIDTLDELEAALARLGG
ncbi:MAG: HAD family hydrolase [Planctomycetota bacterium]